MTTEDIPRSLQDLQPCELYRLVGEAWCAQFRPVPGSAVYLPSLEEIGRMQFTMLAPLIRVEQQRHPHKRLIDITASAVEQHANWSAPALVVAALAAKRGLAV